MAEATAPMKGNHMLTDEILETLGVEGEAGFYGDTWICPCGDELELDGTCSEGHSLGLF